MCACSQSLPRGFGERKPGPGDSAAAPGRPELRLRVARGGRGRAQCTRGPGATLPWSRGSCVCGSFEHGANKHGEDKLKWGPSCPLCCCLDPSLLCPEQLPQATCSWSLSSMSSHRGGPQCRAPCRRHAGVPGTLNTLGSRGSEKPAKDSRSWALTSEPMTFLHQQEELRQPWSPTYLWDETKIGLENHPTAKRERN